MADASKKEAMTNTTPNSCVEVNCDCNTMWSLAQQFSTKRLCVETGKDEGKLVEDYAVRARRIAATYARFYLELEDGGDPAKIGRYYWMALGAFASKTVACAIDSMQIRMMTSVSTTVHEGLGKGNFWLFCDISGWHWYHNNHRSSFASCLQHRNAKQYTKAVQEQMEYYPWKKTALKAIRDFSSFAQIKKGFDLVQAIENSSNTAQARTNQFAHLMAIAEHEQAVILQPLIYDDAAFSDWIGRQRSWYAHWASPALELVFSHKCSTENLELKSLAPPETQLEKLSSRMEWIKRAATKFDVLMNRQKEYMHSELNHIAAWTSLPDAEPMHQGNAI